MRIGSYKLKNNLFLAPMAGVTDRPFRSLCRRLGAGMAASEMVSSNSLLWGSKKTKRRADHTGEDEPRAVQIVGSDPSLMAQAARYNAERGAQIIDINMGCPAKKICNVYAGSALMQNEKLVAKILQSVVNSVDVPVTLKIRTGWDRANKNGTLIAHVAEDCGIQALAVHGRTRADAFQGEAEYETIAAIKAAVRIPIIANGDITTPEKAALVLQRTGADGLMIGRAAHGRPWIFREIEHYLRTGSCLASPAAEEIGAVLLEHMAGLYALYGHEHGCRVARKHIGWTVSSLPRGEEIRREANRLETASAQLAALRGYFDRLAAAANDGQAAEERIAA